MCMPTLIDWIEQQMAIDDEDRGKQSLALRWIYESSSPPQRQALNDALICLCGYSFDRALESSSEDDVPETMCSD